MPALRRKDPVHLYYTLAMIYGTACAGYVGGFEPGILVSGEPTVRYHPEHSVILTYAPNRDEGHW